MHNFFTPYQKQISELCKEYKVQRLFAFGSVLTDKFNEASDVDLLVGFDKKRSKTRFYIFSISNIRWKICLDEK